MHVHVCHPGVLSTSSSVSFKGSLTQAYFIIETFFQANGRGHMEELETFLSSNILLSVHNR